MEERKSLLLNLITGLKDGTIRIIGDDPEDVQDRQSLLEQLESRLLLWDLLESETGQDWDFIFDVAFPRLANDD